MNILNSNYKLLLGISFTLIDKEKCKYNFFPILFNDTLLERSR